MKYTIHNVQYEADSFDKDYVHIRFDVHFTEPEILKASHSVNLQYVLHYIRAHDQPLYQYFEDTRNSLDRWGPAETETLETLGGDAIERIYYYAEQYLLSCDWMPRLFEQRKQWQSYTPGKQMQHERKVTRLVSEMDKGKSEFQNSIYRNRKFCEKTSKSLRDIALEIYPEIADMKPEALKEFKHLFVSEIISMSSKLEKLMMNGKE